MQAWERPEILHFCQPPRWLMGQEPILHTELPSSLVDMIGQEMCFRISVRKNNSINVVPWPLRWPTHLNLSGIFQVLALKVPHPGKSLGPRQIGMVVHSIRTGLYNTPTTEINGEKVCNMGWKRRDKGWEGLRDRGGVGFLATPVQMPRPQTQRALYSASCCALAVLKFSIFFYWDIIHTL